MRGVAQDHRDDIAYPFSIGFLLISGRMLWSRVDWRDLAWPESDWPRCPHLRKSPAERLLELVYARLSLVVATKASQPCDARVNLPVHHNSSIAGFLLRTHATGDAPAF
jgi:hypothetical protein